MFVARLAIVIALILGVNAWVVSASRAAAARVSGEAYGVAVGAPAAPVAGSPFVVLPAEGGSLSDSSAGAGIGFGGIVGNADQLNSTSTGSPAVDGGSVTSTTTISLVELFAGIIRATDVQVVATSTQDGSRAFSSASVQFGSLIVAGLPYPNPAPNERVDLPGIGFVVLNEQIPGGDGRTTSSMLVRAIRVVVTGTGVLDLPAGSEVIAGSAASGVPDIANRTPVVSGPPPTPTRVAFQPIAELPPLDLSVDNDVADDNDNAFEIDNDNGNDNAATVAGAGTGTGGGFTGTTGTRTGTIVTGTSGPLVVTVVVVVVTPTATPTPKPKT
jgi:hypothetical protein